MGLEECTGSLAIRMELRKLDTGYQIHESCSTSRREGAQRSHHTAGGTLAAIPCTALRIIKTFVAKNLPELRGRELMSELATVELENGAVMGWIELAVGVED